MIEWFVRRIKAFWSVLMDMGYTETSDSDSREPQKQIWESIKPESDSLYTLLTLPAPWQCVLDLSLLDPVDTLELTMEYGFLNKSDYTDDILLKWVVAERYRIAFRTDQVSKDIYLLLNNTPIGIGRIVVIESLDGPWEARLTYKQTSGIAKVVRYMILE